MAEPEAFTTVRQLLADGAWLDAERAARQARSRHPQDPIGVLLQGLAVAAMGEAGRAAKLLREAAQTRSAGPHPIRELFALQPKLPRPLILRQCRACLDIAADDLRLRLAFAEYLLDHEAANEAEIVLDGTDGSAAANHLKGLVQAELGHFPAAIASFSRAVALDPDAPASWSNLGMILKIDGQFEQALVAHDRAVALAPESPRFAVNRSVALLKAGRWGAAWRDYEARLSLDDRGDAIAPGRLLPALSDLGDLTGLTILALHEEGFGDTLQFLRYLPLLAKRGARVVARVPRALLLLMRSVPGVTEVVADTDPLPAHDYVCPFFSLPRAFATTVDTVPPPVRLRPELGLNRAALPDLLRVGLVWAGQSRPWLPGFRTLDRRRSAGLAAFAPLGALRSACFVSLQMGPARDQTPPAGMTLIDGMAGVTDFADTAAVIDQLDVVVSVDTSVVHLAGSLDKPVFLLDRYDGCWRWLSGRDDSPWYPRLTIFRQQQPDDWTTPMAGVADALRTMAGSSVRENGLAA